MWEEKNLFESELNILRNFVNILEIARIIN